MKEPHAQALASILVTECTGGDVEYGAYRLQNVQLDVQAYQLRTQLDQERNQHNLHEDELVDNVEDSGKTKVLILPSTELDGLWESYGDPLFLKKRHQTHGYEQSALRPASTVNITPRHNSNGWVICR
jgi:hypothetical protein